MESHYRNLELSYENYVKMGSTLVKSRLEIYYVHELIGSGSFGDVYAGMNEKTKTKVAFKVIDLTKIDKEFSPKVRDIRQRLATTEPQLMMACNSNNIVKCYDVYQNKWLTVMVI